MYCPVGIMSIFTLEIKGIPRSKGVFTSPSIFYSVISIKTVYILLCNINKNHKNDYQ